MGTARPAATSRGTFAPTRLHFTGFRESAVDAAISEGANRYASLCISYPNIHRRGAIPASLRRGLPLALSGERHAAMAGEIDMQEAKSIATAHEHAPIFFSDWYNIGRSVVIAAVGFLALIII